MKRIFPDSFDPVYFELGMIASTQNIKLFFLPVTNDGKVTVQSTLTEDMRDFIAIPVTHSMSPELCVF